MQPATLCFVQDGDRLLLIEKKRGAGEGLWNGPGGKVYIGGDWAFDEQLGQPQGGKIYQQDDSGVWELVYDGDAS